MKTGMIAALAAAQLMAAAAPAWGAERPLEGPATQSRNFAGARLSGDVELGLREEQTQELRLASASGSAQAEATRPDEPRKKRKSTADKVLTGAAVVLGIGALAVGGLLVAIFVN